MYFVERGRPQMTIWRMRIACWISKATDTHSEYVIPNRFFTSTVVARTLLNFTLYIHYLPILIMQLTKETNISPGEERVFFWFLVKQGQNTWCVFDWDKRFRNSFGFYHISCFLSPWFCSFGAAAFQREQTAVNLTAPESGRLSVASWHMSLWNCVLWCPRDIVSSLTAECRVFVR